MKVYKTWCFLPLSRCGQAHCVMPSIIAWTTGALMGTPFWCKVQIWTSIMLMTSGCFALGYMIVSVLGWERSISTLTSIHGHLRGCKASWQPFSDSTAFIVCALHALCFMWSNILHTVLCTRPLKPAAPAAVAVRCWTIAPGDQSFWIAASAMSGQRSGPNQYFAGACWHVGAVPDVTCLFVSHLSGRSMILTEWRGSANTEMGGLQALS